MFPRYSRRISITRYAKRAIPVASFRVCSLQEITLQMTRKIRRLRLAWRFQ